MSHPAWVCGLKHAVRSWGYTKGKSHPAWVCGLKQCNLTTNYILPWSHPAWVCGLKRIIMNNFLPRREVTPCVGVWIETTSWFDNTPGTLVTPCVGVWIETCKPSYCH